MSPRAAGRAAEAPLEGVTQEFVAASPVFEGMDPAGTVALLEGLGARTAAYPDGAAVVSAGDDLDLYLVVVSGHVRSTIEQDDVERPVASFGPGESFAEAAAMTLGFCPASVWAQGATRVLSIPAVPLAASADPLAALLLRNLSVQMSHKVQTLVSYISVIGEPRLQQRILAYLDNLPRRPDGYVELPFSQKQWASALRVDEKSLSRKLAEMRSGGLIEVRRSQDGTFLRRSEWWRPAPGPGDAPGGARRGGGRRGDR